MGVSLSKGQAVSLTKAAEDAGSKLTAVVAGGGWDPATEGKKIDLDLMAVLLGADGKAIADANGNGTNADEACAAYFNIDEAKTNKGQPKGTAHSGDSLDGEGDGDDETVTVTLADLDEAVKEVVFIITSFSGEKFSEVKNASVRLVNASDNSELAKFDLSDNFGDTKAVEMGRLTRDGEFTATGKAIDGEPVDVLKGYGVTGINA